MNANEHQASADAPRAAAAWPDGHRIGNFELQSAMLRGSNAVVYRAWDHSLSRPVAVKEYLPAALALRDAEGTVCPSRPDTAELFEMGLYSFVEEARLLARCDDPSLVRVLDLVEAHGTAYRVMPWYSGRSLRDVRRKMTGPIGEPALRLLLDNLLGALEAFQQVGGVHRGVSPSQALLLDVNRALLMGPGAANRTHRAGATGGLGPASEPGFAPPEQGPYADGQPQGPWTDFYALAAVARFCVTGMPPSAAGLDAPEPLAAAVERMFATRPSVHYNADLLGALDAALSRDITRRPQTAAQFRERLQGVPPPQPVQRPVPAIAIVADTVEPIPRVSGSTPQLDNPLPLPLPLPSPDPQAALPLHAEPEDRDLAGTERPSPPRRKRGVLWAGLTIAVVAAALGAGGLLPSFQRDGAETSAPVAVQPPAAKPPPPATVPAQIEPVETPPPSAAAPEPAASAALAPAPPVLTEPPAPSAAVPTATLSTNAAPPPAPATKRPAADAAARTGATSPRQECGARTEFSLYRCMQLQCSLSKWQNHAQCDRLRATDQID